MRIGPLHALPVLAVAVALVAGCGSSSDESNDAPVDEGSAPATTMTLEVPSEMEPSSPGSGTAESPSSDTESSGTESSDTDSSSSDTESPSSPSDSGTPTSGSDSPAARNPNRFVSVTVGGNTYEFPAVTWCSEKEGKWDITATSGDRANTVHLEFSSASSQSGSFSIGLDNANRTLAGDPAHRWRSTDMQSSISGNSGRGTVSLRASKGNPPPANTAEWSFTCTPF